MGTSNFGGIEEHPLEEDQCPGSVVWFGSSSSCLAFMVSVALQDGVNHHSCLCPRPTYHQFQAQQQRMITTNPPSHFDFHEAIALGYQNALELVSGDCQEEHINASSVFNMLTMRYRGMPVYARAELETIQDDHLKYNDNSPKKNKFLGKVNYLQTIWFSEKDVLDYVLSYLGIGKAKYNSGPRGRGRMEGEVNFSLPCMVEGRCHIFEVQSRAQASKRAEQVAARAALLFMESKFNVKIVDLNYAGRRIAEEEHKSVEFIIYRLLDVARQMKTQLGNMVDCIAGGCAAYSGDPRLMFGGPLSLEQMKAVVFCSENVEVVRADCATRYETVVSMFDKIEKLRYRLG